MLLLSDADFLYVDRADLRLPKQVSSGIVPATPLHHLTRHKQTKKLGSNHSPHITHTHYTHTHTHTKFQKDVFGVNLFIRLLHNKIYSVVLDYKFIYFTNYWVKFY